MKAINIKSKLSKFTKNWHPHQIGIIDDMQVLLAKVKGEFVWHAHEHEDELFQVIKGTLYIQFHDRTEVVNEGEIIIIPKGVEPVSYTHLTLPTTSALCRARGGPDE